MEKGYEILHKNPDSTPFQILTYLKMKGEQTAAAIAKAFGMTNEGARLHLLKLSEQNFVESKKESKGVGRPSIVYMLSERGYQLFPDTHADLTVQLITSIKEELGDEALDKLVKARETQNESRYAREISGEQNIEEKLQALKNIREHEGYMAEWKKVEEGYLFIENHCPICSAAIVCKGLCQSELNNFRNVLGDDVHVQRTEHIVNGARRCVYLVQEVR